MLLDFYIEGRYKGGQMTPDDMIRAAQADLEALSKGVPKLVRKHLKKGLELAIADVKRRRPLRGSKIYQHLRVEDSAVAGDIAMAIRGSKALAVHEFGATIKAKHAQYLTIPLPPALRDGFRKKRPSSRDWANTFVARSKAGNLIIFQRRGRRLVPLYVLKKEIVVPARLGLRDSVANQMPMVLQRILDDADRELNRAG